MATILLTWELGGGLGHLVNLRPFAHHFLRRGHTVYAALRDLSRARNLFDRDDIRLLQAPIRTRTPTDTIEPVHTFAHLLHNVAFSDDVELASLGEAWRYLYQHVDPDLIIFDHSPTALLASRAHRAHRILVGTGFFCPPAQYPLPDLRSPAHSDPAVLQTDEDRLLQRINRVLSNTHQVPLARLCDLYADVDLNVLATFPELDHYPARGPATYFGAWSGGVGKPFDWPPGDGKRIYAYLKPFSSLSALLEALQNLSTPTLVYVDGIDRKVQRQFASKTLRFEESPLDLHQVGRECDLAILNANHGTTVSMLRAGKPTLQIPLHLEQSLLAAAVANLGAGLAARSTDAGDIRNALTRALTTDSFAARAGHFSRKYASFDAETPLTSIMTYIDKLLANRPADPPPGILASTRSIESVDPISLLHPKRFDLLAKHIYARHRIAGDPSDWPRLLYLEHIRVFNGFHENSPPKHGPDAFLSAFDNLIDSIGQNGFDPNLPPVPVGSDGALLNGAHRVAACLALKYPVRIERCPRPGYDFSASWFRRWKRFVPMGLPTWCADAMAIEYARLCPMARLLIMFPSASLSDADLVAHIKSLAPIVYGRRLTLDVDQLQELLDDLRAKHDFTPPPEPLSPGRPRAFLLHTNGPGGRSSFIAKCPAHATLDTTATLQLSQRLFNTPPRPT